MNVYILGNVSTDITTAQVGSTTKATFSVKERKSRKDEAKPNNFWNVTVFGKRAEFASKYLKNGSAVMVSGKADWNEYTGNDGQNKKVLEINADDVSFVPKDFSSQNQQDAAPAAPAAPAPQPKQEDSSDELPF